MKQLTWQALIFYTQPSMACHCITLRQTMHIAIDVLTSTHTDADRKHQLGRAESGEHLIGGRGQAPEGLLLAGNGKVAGGEFSHACTTFVDESPSYTWSGCNDVVFESCHSCTTLIDWSSA